MLPYVIHADPGGMIEYYIEERAELEHQGRKIVIDGMCASACTSWRCRPMLAQRTGPCLASTALASIPTVPRHRRGGQPISRKLIRLAFAHGSEAAAA